MLRKLDIFMLVLILLGIVHMDTQGLVCLVIEDCSEEIKGVHERRWEYSMLGLIVHS